MNEQDRAPLSSSQQEIMEIVWERGEISAFEVREILAERRDVARETVRTLMTRMEEKGWLTHRIVGRTYIYTAAVPRETSLGEHVLKLLDTLCGGSPEKLMTALMDHRGLSDEEAERIQAMIAEARTKSKSKRRKR